MSAKILKSLLPIQGKCDGEGGEVVGEDLAEDAEGFLDLVCDAAGRDTQSGGNLLVGLVFHAAGSENLAHKRGHLLKGVIDHFPNLLREKHVWVAGVQGRDVRLGQAELVGVDVLHYLKVTFLGLQVVKTLVLHDGENPGRNIVPVTELGTTFPVGNEGVRDQVASEAFVSDVPRGNGDEFPIPEGPDFFETHCLLSTHSRKDTKEISFCP